MDETMTGLLLSYAEPELLARALVASYEHEARTVRPIGPDRLYAPETVAASARGPVAAWFLIRDHIRRVEAEAAALAKDPEALESMRLADEAEAAGTTIEFEPDDA